MGDFENDDICKEIALNLTPLVDSPHLKFNLTKGNLIFHFASEISQEEIHDYVFGTLFDLITSFILTEYTDKVSVYLPKDVKEHLFDLENEGENVHIKLNSNKMTMNSEDDIDESLVALLLNEVKKEVKKPSLDYILDKINSKGYESLTQFEKDSLDSYSKN